jgi:hypothetical protein
VSFPALSWIVTKFLGIPSKVTVFLAVSAHLFNGDTVMPLTDIVIRNAKPKEKPYKLADQHSLYLLVNKVGKYFRFDYRFGGKRKTLSLGVYPKSKREARRCPEITRKTASTPSSIRKKPGICFPSRLPTNFWA